MSLHIWRNIYYYMGWEYKPTETTEKIKRDRHNVMVQIRSYGSNIKEIVLGEEGEVRDNTPTLDVGILENEDDFVEYCKYSNDISDVVVDNIRDYTRLFEGVDIPKKKRRKRKRNKSNNFSF